MYYWRICVKPQEEQQRTFKIILDSCLLYNLVYMWYSNLKWNLRVICICGALVSRERTEINEEMRLMRKNNTFIFLLFVFFSHVRFCIIILPPCYIHSTSVHAMPKKNRLQLNNILYKHKLLRVHAIYPILIPLFLGYNFSSFLWQFIVFNCNSVWPSIGAAVYSQLSVGIKKKKTKKKNITRKQ